MKDINFKLSKLEKGFIIVSLIVYSFLFFTFIYNDILETIGVSVNFWDTLFSGNLRAFYGQRWQLTSLGYEKELQAVYDFPIYIVFSIWNFPLWIVKTVSGIDIMNSVPCLMWGKAILLVFTFLIIVAIYKLCQQLDVDKTYSILACVIFLTSNLYLSSVIMMSAYDIIPLLFSVLGVTEYIKGNTKRFIICFMCATTLKYFALLIFIPLYLLKEKNFVKIVGSVLLVMSPVAIFRILIPHATTITVGSEVPFSLMDMLKATDLSGLSSAYMIYYPKELSIGIVHFSLMAYIILFAFSYILPADMVEKYKSFPIYFCVLSYSILFVFCFTHPYWILIIMPFVAVLIAVNKDHVIINLGIDTLLAWGLLIAQMLKFPWCFDSRLVGGMLLPVMLGSKGTCVSLNIVSIQNGMNTDMYLGVGNSLFVAGIVLFLMVNNPFVLDKIPKLLAKNEVMDIKLLLAIRIASGVVIAMVPVILYLLGLHDPDFMWYGIGKTGL